MTCIIISSRYEDAMKAKATSPALKRWSRVALAGPGAICVTIIVMAGMTLWLPGGRAGIDNLVLPLVLAPLIWAVLFFHACLDRNVSRITLVASALLLTHGGLLAHNWLLRPPTTIGTGR